MYTFARQGQCGRTIFSRTQGGNVKTATDREGHVEDRYNYKVCRNERKSGVLMHVTSLPSPYGIGTMGDEALEFIDFLVLSGQSYWQILPLGATGFGDSPYQSFSSRAGNLYLIDPDELVRKGLLSEDAPKQFDFGDDPERVDYGLLWKNRRNLLCLAWETFQERSSDSLKQAFATFRKNESDWLQDYALFMTIKATMNGAPWRSWPDPLKWRNPVALVEFAESHRHDILFEQFIQFLFFRQWNRIREYASRMGVAIIGDLPIYVADDSVEVWQNPSLFQLDETLTPTYVAGCPPDAFSDDGQLWGNPLYDWDAHKKQGYEWWIERFRFQMRLYDIVRIDHFRGLESYWSVPYGDKTARRGQWIDGPADSLIEALDEALGSLPVIAEDLGYMTQEVYEFRERFGFSGMNVLQFAFNPDASNDHLPHNLAENTVLYTGTHDNDTIAAWLANADPRELAFAKQYLGLNAEEGYIRGMLRGAATTVCQTVIFQMQDLLTLGDESRMNHPGQAEGNWRWRMLPDKLTLELASSLRELTRMSGRLPSR
ncbi:MAG: 4-alpha-glucanotransferase [Clostridiaceae bacterium]|nr:4-alpha-glucanotransferase [Clostridiaceae bacterium]